ncbi:MAG: hypothetical protein ACQ5SW_09000 [Sphaerochaetaceae bacterium]
MLQVSFAPLEAHTALEFHIQDAISEFECNASVSPSEIRFKPEVSYHQGDWEVSVSLGSTGMNSSVAYKSLRLSLLRSKRRNRVLLTGKQYGLAYLFPERHTKSPLMIYGWQERTGRIICFWNAESHFIRFNLEASWAEGERLLFSEHIALALRDLTFDWQFDERSQERLHALALQMESQHITAQWKMHMQWGAPPRFGGQTQRMEHTYDTHVFFDLDGIVIKSSRECTARITKTGKQSERIRYTVTGETERYAINLCWDSQSGIALKLKTEHGTVQIREEGFAFSFFLERGPLSVVLALDTKQALSITYTFSLTNVRDNGFLLPR